MVASPVPAFSADDDGDVNDDGVEWFKVSAVVLEPATSNDLWQEMVQHYARSSTSKYQSSKN